MGALHSPCAERILLRRVSPTFGFADVRLPGVHVKGVRVEEDALGRLTIRPPAGIFFQPVTREAIERDLAVQWARS